MDSAGGGGANAVPWRRQGSQGGGSNPPSPAPQAPAPPPPPPQMAPSGGPPPPPPPPMAPTGGIPTVRLSSEIGPRETKGPPMALAGAMMKDKKPFTYTPGGIDLSEIRSPRMAKRMQVNAASEGVTSTPAQHPSAAQQQGGGGGPPPPPPFLPPAAMAAMNPSMAIPVLPQGGFNPQQLNRTQKPSDFVRQEHEQQYIQQPLYPTLPQQLQQQILQRGQQHHQQPNVQHFASKPQYQQPPVQQMAQGEGSWGRPAPATISPAEHQARRSPSPAPVSATGSIYIAPVKSSSPSPQVRVNVQTPTAPAHQKAEQISGEEQRRPNPSKVQARSQNLGSIYIPPIEQRPSVFADRNPNAYNPQASATTPSTASEASSPAKTPQTPQTPTLNKAPTPWMNSAGRKQPQPAAPVTPSANVTPWGTSVSRNIPISISRDDDADFENSKAQLGREMFVQRDADTLPWTQQRNQPNPPSGPRVIPIQIERGDSPPHSRGGRSIPIQIEGTVTRVPVSAPPPQTARGNPYNSPVSTYTTSKGKDAYQRQASELNAGMERLSTGDESPRAEPIQSKSFKVIQKIADDDEQQAAEQRRKLELTGDDKKLMDNIKAQVDEGSLHNTAEPRFRGGHIPSRAFRALQSNLPSSPGCGDHVNISSAGTQQQTSSTGGQVHHIPIRFASPPPSGGGRAGGESSASRLPASQQQVVEPKKYVGGNIPSRSFKILQAMTADDTDSAAYGSLTGDDNTPRHNKKLTSRPPRPPCRSLSSTPVPNSSGSSQSNNSRSNNFVRSRTVSPSPTPRQSNVCTCCCNHNNKSPRSYSQYNGNNNYNNTNNLYNKLSEFEADDYIPTSPRSYSPWPENYDPNYDHFAYMQWYYWWYYNYGYPMGWNQYDYSQGYPQMYSQSQTPNPEDYGETDTEAETSSYDSRYFDHAMRNSDHGHEEEEPERHVPTIVIDSTRESPDAPNSVPHDQLPYSNAANGPDVNGSDCTSDYTEDERDYWNAPPNMKYESESEYSDLFPSQSGCDSELEMQKSANEHDESEFETDYRAKFNATNKDSQDRVHQPNYTSGVETKANSIPRKQETAHVPEPCQEKFKVDCSIFDNLSKKFAQFDNHCSSANETENENIEDIDEGSVSAESSQRTNVGLVEEPDTVSSSEEDAPTLVADSDYRPYDRGVTIEECYSPPVQEVIITEANDEQEFVVGSYDRHIPTRLSTIEELTERSMPSFSVDPNDVSGADEDSMAEYAYEDEENDVSSDEGSSVSVIENKSGDFHNDWGHTTAGESHADEDSSSSDADDENDDDPLLPTVTVQLPMKLSFSKSRSFRDVATLLVGNAHMSGSFEQAIKVDQENTSIKSKEKPDLLIGNDELTEEDNIGGAEMQFVEAEFCIKEDVCESQDYDEDEPVVSYTISLSRSTSKSCEKKESDSDCGGEDLDADPEEGEHHVVDSKKCSAEDDWSDEPIPVSEGVEDETDFWGEIEKATRPEPRKVWGDDSENDHWNNSSVGEATDDSELQPDDEPETCVTVCEVREGDTIEDLQNDDEALVSCLKQEEEEDFWGNLSTEKKKEKSIDNCDTVNFWDRGRTFESNRFSRQFSWDFSQEEKEKSIPINIEVQENVPIPIQIEDTASESETAPEIEQAETEAEEIDFWGEIQASECDANEEIKVPEISESATEDDETIIVEIQEIIPEELEEEVEEEAVAELETTPVDSETEAVPKIHEPEATMRALHSHGRDSVSYISDENSDESTSTLADVKSRTTPAEGSPNQKLTNGHSGDYEYMKTTNRTTKEISENNIEVKETREKFKLGPSSAMHTSVDSEESTGETRPHQRMTRAEDLLWRIERFLQESLSLGSEDDSGVMTDISRQLSDVDTDNDVETEVVMRNRDGRAANRALKTRSMIETSSSLLEYNKVDTSAVVMRNISAEKKQMRYQRAKTHSRLFQLLQDECSRDEEDMDDIDFENLEQVEKAIEKSNQLKASSVANIKESIMSTSEAITDSNRSRLVPLPIKDFLGSSSVSVDSTSSSSGVLSPSSPISRDRLLADIINQFHQRHQSKTKKKVTNFPSKIFKLLQQEFGEEFYDTFDCCEDDFDCTLSTSESVNDTDFASSMSNSGARPSSLHFSFPNDPKRDNCSSPVHTDSITADSSSSSCNTKTDFLEVPQRRKKAVLSRDPRVPKKKTNV